jgi:long-chain acyl-CoA synthetase
MIVSGGENVYPAEIEAVLSSHKDVVQSAVVGRPVEGNEKVVAFVQLIKGSKIGTAELAEYLKYQLAAYKRPSEIILLDALPATSTGKILKHQLAQSLRESEKMAAVN